MAVAILLATVGAESMPAPPPLLILICTCPAPTPVKLPTLLTSNSKTTERTPSETVKVSPLRRLSPAIAVTCPVAFAAAFTAVQVALQLPQLLLLKSSHASVPTLRPSPQFGVHTV